MNIYELNKSIVSQMDILTEEEVDEKVKEIAADIATWPYAMLLSNDRRDYTIFKSKNSTLMSIAKEFGKALKARGSIVLFNKEEDGTWEIWIRDYKSILSTEMDDYYYKVFDCTGFIVDCRG